MTNKAKVDKSTGSTFSSVDLFSPEALAPIVMTELVLTKTGAGTSSAYTVGTDLQNDFILPLGVKSIEVLLVGGGGGGGAGGSAVNGGGGGAGGVIHRIIDISALTSLTFTIGGGGSGGSAAGASGSNGNDSIISATGISDIIAGRGGGGNVTGTAVTGSGPGRSSQSVSHVAGGGGGAGSYAGINASNSNGTGTKTWTALLTDCPNVGTKGLGNLGFGSLNTNGSASPPGMGVFVMGRGVAGGGPGGGSTYPYPSTSFGSPAGVGTNADGNNATNGTGSGGGGGAGDGFVGGSGGHGIAVIRYYWQRSSLPQGSSQQNVIDDIIIGGSTALAGAGTYSYTVSMQRSNGSVSTTATSVDWSVQPVTGSAPTVGSPTSASVDITVSSGSSFYLRATPNGFKQFHGLYGQILVTVA